MGIQKSILKEKTNENFPAKVPHEIQKPIKTCQQSY
jgi:hypothetical protein